MFGNGHPQLIGQLVFLIGLREDLRSQGGAERIKGDIDKPEKVQTIDQTLCFKSISSAVGLSFLKLNSRCEDFWGIPVAIKRKINPLVVGLNLSM